MIELDSRYDRRTLLRGIGVTTLGVGLAGCTGPGGEESEGDEDEEDGESGGDDEDDEGGGYSSEGGEGLHQLDTS